MKTWKFFAYLSFSFLGVAALGGLFVAFASDAGDVGYAYIFALVFTVMAVHSLVYSYWQLTHHPNKVADFSRFKG